MATYDYKIDGAVVSTNNASSSVSGTPHAMWPGAYVSGKWHSIFYCWGYVIGGVVYYQYGELIGRPIYYSGVIADIRLTTPKWSQVEDCTAWARTTVSPEDLVDAVGSSKTIASGTVVYDANGNSHTLTIDAYVPPKAKYTLTINSYHKDGTKPTTSKPTVKIGTTNKAYSSRSLKDTYSKYIYDDIEEGTTVTVTPPDASSGYVISSFKVGSDDRSYSSTYNIDITGNTTVQINYNKTYTITLSRGIGGKSITASSETSFTKETSSATCNSSSNKTLTVESGCAITLSATAEDDYVLYSNAITSSDSTYGSILGDGSTSIAEKTKTCVGDNTFTVNGSQFFITPQIATEGQNAWGTATINGYSTARVLKPNTTYTLGFTSSTTSTLDAKADYWNVGGTICSSTFTTGNAITMDATAYLYLKQTKWQLTVANGTNANWGGVYLGTTGTATSGWYASGTDVTVRFVSSKSDTIAPVAYQLNYNSSTTSCGNTATITTTNASLTATMYLKQTRWRMSVAYSLDGTSDFGSLAFKKNGDAAWQNSYDGSLYVGTGDKVDLKFTPNAALSSTIHPVVDHWTVLQQTATPESNADGSSTTTVTLGTVSSDFTAFAYLASTWRLVTVQRTDSGPGDWGAFYLGADGTKTSGYFEPGSTVTVRFVRNTDFDGKERPQVSAIVFGTENDVPGTDGTYAYAYTLPSNVKTDLTVSCSVKQTAWPVTVSSAGNGSVVAKRIEDASGAIVASVTAFGTGVKAAVIYLRSGTSEYLSLSAEANYHYSFSAWSKTNLADVPGTNGVRLASQSNASISASFTRNDFCVTGRSDNSTVCNVYMQDNANSSAYYLKTITSNPVVVCKIKSAYVGQYRVASFSVGSQNNIEPQYNAAADLYYVEVAGRSDVTVTAHVVKTHYKLTVNVSPDNSDDFGTVVVSAGSAGQEQELARGGYSGDLREGTPVSIIFYEKYGGRVVKITPSTKIASPNQTDSYIAFVMPSADCTVSFTLGAKETCSLTVGIVNIAEGGASDVPGIVRVVSRTYPDIVVGATDVDGVAKTFNVYKGEEYALVTEAVSGDVSRFYAFIGWRDASSMITGATSTTFNFVNEEEDAVERYAAYNARTNGTITIEYAKKEGETITTITADEAKYILSIDNEKDKYDETHWLIGADIDVGYTASGSAYDDNGDAYKWTPVQVDVALAGDDYGTPNGTWDDGLLVQTGTFKMLGNMKVRLVLTHTYVPGYVAMNVGFRLCTVLMGEVSIFATEMDAYTSAHTGARALVQKARKAVIMAAPRPGYAFAGWYTLVDGEWTAVEGATAVHEIDYVTSPMTVYYAQFVASRVSNVRKWNGNASVAKTFEWRSKVYVGAQFFRFTSCRVYADAYPVTLEVYMSSSPDDVFGARARMAKVTVTNQDARRLPMLRPEKYFAFKVTGYARVNHVGFASSMEALK